MTLLAPSPVGLALVGPTASGKTAISIEVARRLEVEVVSMDSRQVYRGMDIGTAKPTAGEREGVPHHLLDVADPSERYSAGRFAREARVVVAGILDRGRVPLFVGGTGFFLRALLQPIFREPRLDPSRREGLRAALASKDVDELARWVRALDPDRADLAVAGGPQRMLRTLEVALLSGRPLTWWHRHAPVEGEPVPLAVVSLEVDPTELASRIHHRTAAMIRAGWVDEVRGLLGRGVAAGAPGMTGTGYREIVAHLRGEAAMDATVRAIEDATRGYARRQRTWFRHQLPAGTLRLEAGRSAPEVADAVVEFWSRRGSGIHEEPGGSGGGKG